MAADAGPSNPPYRKWRWEQRVYWSMNWPVRETQLINRVRVEDDPTQPEYEARRAGVPNCGAAAATRLATGPLIARSVCNRTVAFG
jgi:hypothetical protein